MADKPPSHPLWILTRDLAAAAALGIALFTVFTVFNERLLNRFNDPEILLFEAGAIVLVAFLIARGITNAINAVLARQGLVTRGHAVRLFLNLLIAGATVLALTKLAGVSAESIFIGAGFTGIVLGLASQTVLSNVFAGLLLVVADPFRPGDRVGFVTSQYGLLASTYPHEAHAPAHFGTVEDVGLTYTQVALDAGGSAKIPNGIVIQTMVLIARGPLQHRVRVTFPRTVSVAQVEAALPAIAHEYPAPFAGAPPPRLEVADLEAATWDGVVVLWSAARDVNAVRDRVIRLVLDQVNGPIGT